MSNNPATDCPTCGQPRTRMKSGKPICKPCQREYARKRRAAFTVDLTELAVRTREQVADEMWMRGFPMSYRAVEIAEKRGMAKFTEGIREFYESGVK